MRVSALLLLFVMACTSPSSSQQGDAGTCEPSRIGSDDAPGTEIRAGGTDDIEGWALVFARSTAVPGQLLTITVGEETKIVWRLTGEGAVSFRAVGPEGQVERLTWGPDEHAGSNWARPGDEWGTGWILPAGGCWTMEATRGSAVLTISAEAT